MYKYGYKVPSGHNKAPFVGGMIMSGLHLLVVWGAWEIFQIFVFPDSSILRDEKEDDYIIEESFNHNNNDIDKDEHRSLEEGSDTGELHDLPSIVKPIADFDRDRALTIAEFYASSPDVSRLNSKYHLNSNYNIIIIFQILQMSPIIEMPFDFKCIKKHKFCEFICYYIFYNWIFILN